MAQGFLGFGPSAMAFLKGLAADNSKAFFEAHRATYEADLKAPLAALVETLSTRCAIEGLPFRGGPTTSAFRLNRDVRFSKDNSPYKTHVAAVLTPSGDKKDMSAVLYVHFGHDAAFAATGFYHPERPRLDRLRQAIASDPQAFTRVLAELAAEGLALDEGDPTRRLPGGFEAVADPTTAAAIRKRHFTLRRDFPAAVWLTPGLPDRVIAFGRAARPFLDWACGAGVLGDPGVF